MTFIVQSYFNTLLHSVLSLTFNGAAQTKLEKCFVAESDKSNFEKGFFGDQTIFS